MTVNEMEYNTDMETYEISGGDIQAMVMCDERTLFVRSVARLFEFWLEDGEWVNRREVETELSNGEMKGW